MTKHCFHTTNAPPLLVFPEGTCVNNEFTGTHHPTHFRYLFHVRSPFPSWRVFVGRNGVSSGDKVR